MARVQVTASRPNAELNSSSCEAPVSGWSATLMLFVWPCQLSTVEAMRSYAVSPCFCFSRSTASVASIHRLIAGRQNCHQGIVRSVARLDDGDFAGRRSGVVVLGLL